MLALKMEQEPRNRGGLQKQKKLRKGFFQEPLEETALLPP